MKNELPDGWDEVGLLDYMDLVKPGVKQFNGLKKYIATGSLKTGLVTDFIEVDYKDKPSRANVEVLENDVLFAKMKHTEKLFLIGIEYVDYLFSTGFSVLRIKDEEKLVPKYVYYWLRSNYFQNKKNKECSGATQKAINNNKLKKFKIIVPPLKTQHKIVAILEKAEETKQLREQADELTQQLLQNVFLEMFGDPITNPKNWDLVALDSVCNEIHRYPTFYGFEYVSNGIPVLKISNMDDSGGFLENIEDYDKITNEINKKYPRTIVDDGDIIFEARGTYIGKCALVPPALKGSNISPNTIRISLDKNKHLPEFILYLSFTNGWKSKIENKVNYWKDGFGTIKASDLKMMKIPLPPIQLQQDFIHTVECIESIKQTQQHSSQEIDNFFNALMQKAFNGELVS